MIMMNFNISNIHRFSLSFSRSFSLTVSCRVTLTVVIGSWMERICAIWLMRNSRRKSLKIRGMYSGLIYSCWKSVNLWAWFKRLQRRRAMISFRRKNVVPRKHLENRRLCVNHRPREQVILMLVNIISYPLSLSLCIVLDVHLVVGVFFLRFWYDDPWDYPMYSWHLQHEHR